MLTITKADRLKELPPYLFAELDRKKDAVRARGVDVIDVGVGDPDQPTPNYIIDALTVAARVPAYHRYPSYSGMNSFREAVSGWYQKRAGITLDPLRQVVSLIGSKEGIAHIPLAFINPGDVVLVPSPGYPVYKTATLFAGGTPYEMPLLKENGFLPDLGKIPAAVLARAKMIFLNYPNNPTAATATPKFFVEVVAFANKHNIMVCHDFAYSEMSFDGYEAPSFLATPGALEVGVEFHSLSKTYHMTGWRLGFVAGHAEIISGLGQIKSNIDSGAFEAIQMAGIAAMADDAAWLAKMRALYTERRNVVMAGLKKIGIQAATPRATFYVWAEVPKGYTSATFASHLLENAGIVTTPGNGFGDPGEGYFRIALTVSKERLAEAMERMAKAVGLMARALIGLGSNLGDGPQNLLTAWRLLGATPAINLDRLSQPYRSKPLGYDSPHWFTNAVGLVDTELAPVMLLARLLAVEKAMGRDRQRGMDRIVDLDLLDYDGRLLNEAELTLPHPGIAHRPFVLAPLAGLAPDWQHPVYKKSAAQLLARLHDPDQEATPIAWPEGEPLP